MSGLMNAKDTLYGASASCYAVIDGTRYNFANAIKLEAKAEKNKTKVPILGKVAKGNKAAGVEYSGSMTLHYNSSILRKMMLNYTKDGKDIYFDVQVVNEDKTSGVGRQTVTLYDCNIDSIILAKFDADGDYLDEDVDFTFEDWDLPEEFKQLSVFSAT